MMIFLAPFMKNRIKSTVEILLKMTKQFHLLQNLAKEALLKEELIHRNIFVRNFFSITNWQAILEPIEKDNKGDTKDKEIS